MKFEKENFIKIFIIPNLFVLLESIIYTFLFNDYSYFSIGQINPDPGGDFYLFLLFSRSLNPYKYDLTWGDAQKVYSDIFAYKNTNFIFSIIVILILSFILSNYIIKKNKISYTLSNVLSFN